MRAVGSLAGVGRGRRGGLGIPQIRDPRIGQNREKPPSAEVGITEQNLSPLKSGKVKGIRFETLARICAALDCQPGDLLEAVPSGS